MGRWLRPEVYPLLGAVSFVMSLCLFQLTRNAFMNPEVRVNKAHRASAVLENHEEGQKYSRHGLRRFLRHRPPEVMPAVNTFFAGSRKE
ncbi:uncharacterized protein LOC122017640 [Zingiber officinale]|uniref:B12D protein n=1 Tax=Zingiber officinale TaxID=94328 RepID=A0A8J5F6U1_ZINOF|nr:uncharacterized protein LOC122017640 [Zingiber officinale]KAG6482231.1 hypothetical protein ZIOFF_058862 [Zingiber officinale]